MKSNSFVRLTLLLAFLLAVAVTVSQARGGRRGGGSFGGFLGGWRKYKKPVSAGNSRRTTNGSPMHTTITKSSSSGGSSSGSSLKATKQAKEHGSYPKQEMPSGAGPALATGAGHHAGGYYGSGAVGAAHLPPGGTYYANTASMPIGAVYYAQPPMRSSSGTDFLFGMMAGHALFGHRPHVTHVYQQSSQPAAGSGSTVLVINKGEGGDSTTAPAQVTTSPPSWPAELDVPLAPFNATITTPEMLHTATVILPSSNNSSTTAPLPQAPVQPVEPVPPPAGIICVPMLFNETDPNDPDSTQHVEKIICFPAPPPPTPTPQFPVAADTLCITRTLTERDPSDPTKTIEILEQDCAPATMPAATTTSTVAPPVAGDIGDGDVVDVPLPE